MSKIFFTSDTHFGHENIINYCNRPFTDVQQMDSYLINAWNSVVHKEDIVYILGDFSFRTNVESSSICKKLNGTKYLVKGNHDESSNYAYRKMGFEDVYDHPIVLDTFLVLSHQPLPFIIGGPMVNIYGHVHNSEMHSTFTRCSACVCTERHFYRPIALEDIMSGMRGA